MVSFSWLPMRATGTARRTLDCVVVVRIGNIFLIVKGYFKQKATETDDDKMTKDSLFINTNGSSIYEKPVRIYNLLS